MLSRTAASGANSIVSSSWNDEASQTTTAPGSMVPTSELAAVPTLPATATATPASRWMWPISSVVVVLPFVPVMAMNSCPPSSRQASSSSPRTGRPRRRAAATTAASAGTPGDLIIAAVWSSSSTPSVARRTPGRSTGGRPASTPIASSPSARSVLSAETPERARPTTRYGPPGRGGRGVIRAWGAVRGVGSVPLPKRLLVDGEADRRADRGHDPEAQDDLGLRPRHQLEVVVDRRHQEHPLAEGLEGEDLDQHAQRLDHEDPAEQDQQDLGARHHRETRDRAAQPERPCVAHEDRRRERVEPQEADAGAHEAAAEQRKVLLAPRDERDPDVGQQHDRGAARGQAVEPVGEVHRVRRARHDEVDQDGVEDPEVDPPIDDPELQRALEPDALG